MRPDNPERTTQRSGLRADEPLFLIPDTSDSARCRALVAADIDRIERSAVTVTPEGLMVPACVQEVYGELAGTVVACECDSGPELVAVWPPLVADEMGQHWIIGSWHATAPFDLFVNGEVVREGDRGLLSGNVIELWALPGEWPWPPPDSAGTVYSFRIEQLGRTSPEHHETVLPA